MVGAEGCVGENGASWLGLTMIVVNPDLELADLARGVG